MSRKFFTLLSTSLLAFAIACGDDDDDSTGNDGGPDGGESMDSGTAGMDASMAGKGGTGGTGGSTAGTGGTMATDAGDLYKCKPAAEEPGGTSEAGETCCSGLGICTENPSGTAAEGYGLDECKAGEDLKCVPMLPTDDIDGGLDADGGTAPIASCRVELPENLVGDLDLEGRCVPSCFITGDASTSNLGQSSCDTGSKCVPCYSPVTGASTGACGQAGDAPVEAAPPGFAECGDDDVGYCVGAGAVAGAGMVNLPQLTCAGGEVCAPKLRVLDQKACFAHCESGIGGPGASAVLGQRWMVESDSRVRDELSTRP